MKTAVSIPDAIYRAAEKYAKKKRLSRSKLYAQALAEFLKDARDRERTAAYDRLAGEVDTSLDPEWRKASLRTLRGVEWKD